MGGGEWQGRLRENTTQKKLSIGKLNGSHRLRLPLGLGLGMGLRLGWAWGWDGAGMGLGMGMELKTAEFGEYSTAVSSFQAESQAV